jgi:hypothetical protein
MTAPTKYRLASEELVEVVIEMIIKRAVNSVAITGMVPAQQEK